MLSSFKLESSW